MPRRRLLARLLGRHPTEGLKAARALWSIVAVTTSVTILAGAAIWLVDRTAYPTFGAGLWWALQTVTTVGYGDHLPDNGAGRAVAAVLMIAGISFISVATASVVAMFIESARRRLEPPDALASEIRMLREEVEALRTELRGH